MGQASKQVLPLKIDTEALHTMLEGVGSLRVKRKGQNTREARQQQNQHRL